VQDATIPLKMRHLCQVQHQTNSQPLNSAQIQLQIQLIEDDPDHYHQSITLLTPIQTKIQPMTMTIKRIVYPQRSQLTITTHQTQIIETTNVIVIEIENVIVEIVIEIEIEIEIETMKEIAKDKETETEKTTIVNSKLIIMKSVKIMMKAMKATNQLNVTNTNIKNINLTKNTVTDAIITKSINTVNEKIKESQDQDLNLNLDQGQDQIQCNQMSIHRLQMLKWTLKKVEKEKNRKILLK
jgi:hypothetical protein